MLAHTRFLNALHESNHLVALDEPFSQRIPLFVVRLSILNVITLYGVLITKTKTISNTFALISIGFCFSLSSFLN
jgi:hypothetical protein